MTLPGRSRRNSRRRRRDTVGSGCHPSREPQGLQRHLIPPLSAFLPPRPTAWPEAHREGNVHLATKPIKGATSDTEDVRRVCWFDEAPDEARTLSHRIPRKRLSFRHAVAGASRGRTDEFWHARRWGLIWTTEAGGIDTLQTVSKRSFVDVCYALTSSRHSQECGGLQSNSASNRALVNSTQRHRHVAFTMRAAGIARTRVPVAAHHPASCPSQLGLHRLALPARCP